MKSKDKQPVKQPVVICGVQYNDYHAAVETALSILEQVPSSITSRPNIRDRVNNIIGANEEEG